METRLSNTFKTTNFTKLTKAILESSYRVLQVMPKWKTLNWLVYFSRAVENIQIDITLAMFGKKFGETTLFRRPT